jgi:hypothetical protein
MGALQRAARWGMARAPFWYAAMVSLIAISAGAALWIVGAMIVAFPTELLNWHYSDILGEFFKYAYHPASVLILWIVDIIIAVGVLNNSEVRDAITTGPRFAICFASIGIFLMVGIMLPAFAAGTITTHPVIVAGVALLSISIPRGLSYVAPTRSRPA